MDVLLSYKFEPDTTPLGFECERAFIELGHKVHRMEVDRVSARERLMKPVKRLFGRPGEDAQKRLLDERNRKILELVEAVRPDMVFVVIGYNYYPETLEAIRKKYGARVCGWWVEYPPSFEPYVDTFEHYDAMFTFSTKAAELIGALGSTRCEYVNYGTDVTLYRPMKLSSGERARYSAEISFLGKYKPRRRLLLSGLAADGLRIWGPLWKKEVDRDDPLDSCIMDTKLYGDGPAKLFSASRVNVNINSWDMSYGPNLRVFDIPACGGFLLTEYVEELDGLFDIGGEIETFRDADELAGKARYYLGNESAREKVARRGFEKVVDRHKLSDCIGRILAKI